MLPPIMLEEDLKLFTKTGNALRAAIDEDRFDEAFRLYEVYAPLREAAWEWWGGLENQEYKDQMSDSFFAGFLNSLQIAKLLLVAEETECLHIFSLQAILHSFEDIIRTLSDTPEKGMGRAENIYGVFEHGLLASVNSAQQEIALWDMAWNMLCKLYWLSLKIAPDRSTEYIAMLEGLGPENPDRLLIYGTFLLKEGRKQEAHDFYQQHMSPGERLQNNPIAYKKFGSTLKRLKRFNEAFEFYEQHMAPGGILCDNIDAHIDFAQLLISMNKIEMCYDFLQNLIVPGGILYENKSALALLGHTLIVQYKFDEAMEILSPLLGDKRLKKDKLFLQDYGVGLIGTNRLAEAREFFSSLLAENGPLANYKKAWGKYGEVLCKMDPEAAVAFYPPLIAKGGILHGDEYSISNFVEVLMNLGRPDEALALLAPLIATGGVEANNKIFLHKYGRALRMADPGAALAFYSPLLAEGGILHGEKYSINNFAGVMIDLEKFDEALALLGPLIASGGLLAGNAAAHQMYGRSLCASDAEAALAFYPPLIAEGGILHDDVYAYGHYSSYLAQSYMNSGASFEAAASALEKTLGKFPGNGPSYFWLSVIYIHHGKLLPDSAEGAYQVAWRYAENGIKTAGYHPSLFGIFHHLACQGFRTEDFQTKLDQLKRQQPGEDISRWAVVALSDTALDRLQEAAEAEMRRSSGNYARAHIFDIDGPIPRPINKLTANVMGWGESHGDPYGLQRGDRFKGPGSG